MSYKIEFTPKAEQHLKEWKQSGQMKILKKIVGFLEELKEHPTQVPDKSNGSKVITPAIGVAELTKAQE